MWEGQETSVQQNKPPPPPPVCSPRPAWFQVPGFPSPPSPVHGGCGHESHERVCRASPGHVPGLDSALLVEKLSLFFLRSTCVTQR